MFFVGALIVGPTINFLPFSIVIDIIDLYLDPDIVFNK